MPLNCVEQTCRLHHPFEWVQGDDGDPLHERKHEAGDEAHVVVQRKPRGNPVVRRQAERRGVSIDLPQNGAMGQLHTLLQAGGSRAVLKERDIIAAYVSCLASNPVTAGADLRDAHREIGMRRGTLRAPRGLRRR